MRIFGETFYAQMPNQVANQLEGEILNVFLTDCHHAVILAR